MEVKDLPNNRMKQSYLAIIDYIKKHPETTVSKAAEITKSHLGSYYVVKSQLNGGRRDYGKTGVLVAKRKYKTKMISIPIAPLETDKLCVFVGSPEAVARAAKEFMK